MSRTAERRAIDEKTYRRRLNKRRIRKHYGYDSGCKEFTPKEVALLKNGHRVEWRCRCDWCMALEKRSKEGPQLGDWQSELAGK